MTIESTTRDSGIVLIEVNGRLDHSQTATLETHIDTALEQAAPHIIVDLSATDYINSGGLRTLVSGWRRAKEKEGKLLLCGLNERLQQIFSMVGFDKVFTIYDDISTAAQTLTSPPE